MGSMTERQSQAFSLTGIARNSGMQTLLLHSKK
jgi:hypothetical protein